MKKYKKDKYNVSFEDSLENPKNVASSTDCTGLIQTPPSNEEESEAFSDLNKIPKPRDRFFNPHR
ncbi:MAG: hypothetical protein PHD66_01010 [Eubacteriales bacterium]|nr:hypothetical protein [Eubacteriales bacterium]